MLQIDGFSKTPRLYIIACYDLPQVRLNVLCHGVSADSENIAWFWGKSALQIRQTPPFDSSLSLFTRDRWAKWILYRVFFLMQFLVCLQLPQLTTCTAERVSWRLALRTKTSFWLISCLAEGAVLDPKVYKKFKLIEKIEISHNTALWVSILNYAI